MERKKKSAKINKLLKVLKSKAELGENIMETSIECAHAGVTTGEWGKVTREVYGEYRAPTGILFIIKFK